MTHAYNLDEAKGHHSHSAKEGYQPAEYEHQEYPKHIHSVRLGETVSVNNQEEEAFHTIASDSQADGEK